MITADWEDDGIQLSNDGADVFWLSASEAESLIDRLRQILDDHPED
jgi:hypothetical protein